MNVIASTTRTTMSIQRACEGCRRQRRLRVSRGSVGRPAGRPTLFVPFVYSLHRHVREREPSENWSKFQCVTFGPTMLSCSDHRYGTHGTTSVISCLSRSAQHVGARAAGLGDAPVDVRVDRGTLVRLPVTPSFLALLLRSDSDQRVVRVAGRDDVRAVEERARRTCTGRRSPYPSAGRSEIGMFVGDRLDGRVRAVDRTHLERDADLRRARLDDRQHALVDGAGVRDHQDVLALEARADAALGRRTSTSSSRPSPCRRSPHRPAS